MAKVTHFGPAKPDDPIYKSGPVIGAKRFGPSSKSGGGDKAVLTRLTPDMTREQKKQNLIDALEQSGIKVRAAPQQADDGGAE